MAEENTIDPITLSEDQQIAFRVLQEVCENMEEEVQPVIRDVQGPYLHIEMLGEEMRSTWGRSGAGLDALQLLCNLIMGRHTRADIRILLDAGGYRERRIESLRQRALDVAAAVVERNQEAEIEPLPPHERRIIHTTLADHPDVRTYSEGSEPMRRIVVSPR